MSGTSSSSTVNPVQQNLALRAAFIQNSLYVRKTLPSVPIIAGVSNYAIPLSNQGALVGIDLEVTLDITNGSTTASAVPNVGAPYSFLGNINFVDQSNVTRHNLSGRFLYDYLTMRNGQPWDSAVSLGNGGANIPVISDVAAPTLAASGTGVVKFLVHVPIAKNRNNTTGMVLLQTGNQNQPAVLNVALTNLLNGQANGPYNEAISITGGSIVPHQCYYQPQSGAVAPPIDTQVQWVLFETGNDNTNLAVGMDKQVLFQTQFATSLVGIRYFNGSSFESGGDMTSVLEKTLGGTFVINDDNPTMRYRRYRLTHGYDCAPGLYWFDYQSNPLQYQAVGIYEADFVPSVVNAGAYITTLYDWLKVPSQLAALPGGSQIG